MKLKTIVDAFKTPPRPALTPNCSNGKGDFNVEVVGEQNYQPELRRLLQESGPERVVVAEVKPEPTNKFDPKAVAVLSPLGRIVGYLPKESMWIVQPALVAYVRANRRALCQGRLVGGTVDKPTIGIWLDLDLAAVGVRADQITSKGLRKDG